MAGSENNAHPKFSANCITERLQAGWTLIAKSISLHLGPPLPGLSGNRTTLSTQKKFKNIDQE
jgi:hypothetical protein